MIARAILRAAPFAPILTARQRARPGPTGRRMGDGGMSYDDLLDDEVRAFIARTDAFYPPEAVDFTVAEQRRLL